MAYIISDDDLEFFDDEKVCGYCAHWDIKGEVRINQYDTQKRFHGSGQYCPCMIDALEPDAGDSITVTKAGGHCRNHADAWEPSEYIKAIVRERMTPREEWLGLTPGIDFPATLGPGSRHAA